MFRNYLDAAWGDLVRSPVQSLIAIGGLAIGLMASIIAGIVTYDAFTRDHDVGGYDRLYVAVMEEHSTRGDSYFDRTSYNLADYLRGLPGVDAVARTSGGGPAIVGRGDIQAREVGLVWADPEFFRIYRMPALYGDSDRALDRPDGLVISLSMARKYFGDDDVVGKPLMLNHKPMIVRAVLADWIPNSRSYAAEIYASALSPDSQMSHDIGSQGMAHNGQLVTDMVTWVRLAPGASLDDLNRRGTALVSQFVPASVPYRRALHFERSDDINMSPRLHPDDRAHLYVMEAVALVILSLSCINFINLSVARSTQRALEVGVRKAAGAGWPALMLQFLGEAILQVLLALCVAIALVEWSLPAVNAFLKSAARFDYWRNPGMLATMLAGAILVGVLAGSWPALVLSQFRPADVLKGWRKGTARAQWLRQGLVALQFGALIVFLISAATVFQQNAYSTAKAMQVNTDRMLFITMPHCTESLRERMARVPGVSGTACSSLRVLPTEGGDSEMAKPPNHGEAISVQMVPVNVGFFELFDIRPLAGRLFRPGAGDAVVQPATAGLTVRYIVNEAAVRQMHYPSAQAAIGQPLFHDAPPPNRPGDPPPIYPLPGTIIGVVKDFSFAPEDMADGTPDHRIPPVAYSAGSTEVNLAPPPELLHVKFDGSPVAETLSKIDDAWKATGAHDPILRQFLNEYVRDRADTTRKEGQAFAVFAGIAMLLACLGMFGVALSTAARRTKEIGIRKAMGATNRDVLALLLWQFAKPVLWANLLAWPLAWWAMTRWLSGFAYHVTLGAWLFPASGAIALLIALAAVAGQAILVVRQKAVLALRHE